jgi:NADH dehydrogenase FAD-containing subunit
MLICRLDYDWLSLNVGSEADTSWLQTLGNKLLPVKPLDDFYLKWLKVLREAKAKANFRLVVVGAGAAGVEIALAAKHAFTESSLDGQVELIAALSGAATRAYYPKPRSLYLRACGSRYAIASWGR